MSWRPKILPQKLNLTSFPPTISSLHPRFSPFSPPFFSLTFLGIYSNFQELPLKLHGWVPEVVNL
ncbi:hypothetical protein CDL12_26286 [Handroanthus impetiginosus]|uniref:Uncharacterized protein n=1 Tax=Handroanthus impetiginosus TaxID=429701 RepID=A0A2G9G7C5_9LAMI|nr:hypothetical protein CDL12_26286 [Handroanthus impetiginosus]